MHFSSQNGNEYTTNLNEIKVNCYYEIFAVPVKKIWKFEAVNLIPAFTAYSDFNRRRRIFHLQS